MVTRLLKGIGAPIRGVMMRPVTSVHQAAYWLAALTLASQLLALLRDRAFAASFGAGPILDAYYAAFRVPDLVFALVASLVSAYVLIPRITGMERARVRETLSHAASFLLIAGGGLCLALAAFMPQLLALLYPDLAASALSGDFILLARLLLIQPILLGVAGVIASVTQVYRRFVLFALAPVLYNLGIIAGILLFYPRFGLAGLGAGVILGALCYGAVNLPTVLEHRVVPRLVRPRLAVVWAVMRDSIPRSLALGMGSATLLALTVLASRLGEGAVSVFTLAGNLEAVPLALIGSSYAVAAFPALSEAVALARRREFSRLVSASARHILVWSVVALGLIVVLRAHVVRAVLGAGAFDWDATRLTSALLALLAAALVAQGLVLLFSRALYAARESWRPLAYQAAGAALSVALALALLALPPDGFPASLARLLKVEGVEGSSVLLLALAASVGQIAVAALAFAALSRKAPGLARSLARPLGESVVAALAGGAAAYGVLAAAGGIAPLTTLVAVITEGALAGAAGLAAAALTLRALGNEELRDITAALSRFWSARSALPPSAEEPAQP